MRRAALPFAMAILTLIGAGEGQGEGVGDLTRLLGSDEYAERERATAALIALGKPALAEVTPLQNSDDPEVARRASYIAVYINARASMPFSRRFLLSYPRVYYDLARGKDPLDLLREMMKGTTSDGVFLNTAYEDQVAIINFIAAHGLDRYSPDDRRYFIQAAIEKGGNLPVATFEPLLDDPDEATRSRAFVLVRRLPDEQALKLFGRALHDEAATVRRVAVSALVNRGSRYLNEVLPLLNDPDSSVRREVIEAIARAGNKEHVALLTPLLKDVDDEVVWRTIKTIKQLGGGIDDLDRYLRHQSPGVRHAAFDAHDKSDVAKIFSGTQHLLNDPCDSNACGRGCPVWEYFRNAQVPENARTEARVMISPLLMHKDPNVRRIALGLMSRIGVPDDLPFILPLLQDPDAGNRQMAWRAYESIAPDGFLDNVLNKIETLDHYVKGAAIQLLKTKSDKTLKHLDRLLSLLKTADAEMAREIIVLIETAKPGASVEKAVPIIAQYRQTEPAVGSYVIRAYEQTKAQTPTSTFQRLLREGDTRVRPFVVEILSNLGPSSLESVASLLNDPDPEVRRAAVRGIGRIEGAAKYFDEMTRFLNDEDSEVRQAAASALARIDGARAAGHLTPLLEDPDSEVRNTIIGVLYSSSDKEVKKAVLGRLNDRCANVRSKVLDIITNDNLEKDLIPETIPLVAKSLHDPDPVIRYMTIRVLQHLEARDLWEETTSLLRDDDNNVRYYTLGYLKTMKVVESLPLVLPLLQDRDGSVRHCAYEVFDALDPEGTFALSRVR